MISRVTRNTLFGYAILFVLAAAGCVLIEAALWIGRALVMGTHLP